SLLLFVKEFVLDISEIEPDKFREKVDAVLSKIESAGRAKPPVKRFEKHKVEIADFIDKQKAYLNDREKEFRDIIDLLSKAMANVNADNEDFNLKVYEQSEKLEKIIRLDDIRKLKSALQVEVENIREVIREKEASDKGRVEVLSRQVETLSVELAKVREESMRDGLTDAYNRKAFDRQIKNLVQRNSVMQAPFALMMIDIDDFKVINDNYGHPLGDRVLVSMVAKCRDFVRAEDFPARYGGEEFAIILPGASLKNAVKKAKHICKAIAATSYRVEGEGKEIELSITVSIGVSAFCAGDAEARVIERADKALYAAKHAGKNRVVSEKEIKSAQ
ncbi:MAG: diguanylate cyclase, partial [Desulfobacterales bacterium]|nr:diguanylate cyclase [Desulfobacterales bacterium]